MTATNGQPVLGSVAVLSDIHGVLPVLDAILAEPDVQVADLVVVTGDHAAGPMPVGVLDRLVQLGPRVVLVRGNADRELVEVARGGSSPHPESAYRDRRAWAEEYLRSANSDADAVRAFGPRDGR